MTLEKWSESVEALCKASGLDIHKIRTPRCTKERTPIIGHRIPSHVNFAVVIKPHLFRIEAIEVIGLRIFLIFNNLQGTESGMDQNSHQLIDNIVNLDEFLDELFNGEIE